LATGVLRLVTSRKVNQRNEIFKTFL
jgi:hypothetical protein